MEVILRTGDRLMPRQFRKSDAVVLAGCLLALLLVASFVLASRAREDARQLQCSYNMRQCALALIQYANMTNAFPPSEYTATGWSGMAAVVPYLAPGKLYYGRDSNRPRWASANKDAVALNLPEFLCPSNPNTSPVPASKVMRLDGTTDPGSNRYAMGHYGVNWGGGRGPWGKAFTKAAGAYRGVMIPDFAAHVPLKPIADADIIDGKAMTLLLVEKRDSQGWAVGGWAGSEFDVGTSPAVNVTDSLGEKVYSGSYHPGGVNVTFCDGSAHFLTTKIKRKVWYALITRDGNEPVTDVSGGGEFSISQTVQDGK